MAVVGHWASLAEAQKLVNSPILRGVMQTTIEEGGILARLPTYQITGKNITYNRESTLVTAGKYDIHEQIPWTASVDYTQRTSTLYRYASARLIDKFLVQTYKDPNDLKAIAYKEVAKGFVRTLEDALWYADETYGVKEFDGLHAFAEEGTGDNDIDQGDAALSLMDLRRAIDAVRGPGGRVIVVGREIGRRFDQLVQEAGVAGGDTNTRRMVNGISFTTDQLGQRVMAFDGIPIVRSDYLVAETNATGQGSDARAKWTTGTKYYSLFVLRVAPLEDGGISVCYGGEESPGTLYRVEEFDKLENYDAGGLRLVSYVGLAVGSPQSIARISDITDAAIVV